MKLRVIFFMLLLAAGNTLFAQNTSHRAAAEEFLLLINTDKMIEPMTEQMKRMFQAQFSQLGGDSFEGINVDTYLEAMTEILNEVFAWEKIKDEYIDVYTETFTEQELKELIAFYSTETGKKYTELTPQVNQRTMLVAQGKMTDVMMRMQAVSEQMINDLKAAGSPEAKGTP